MLSRFDDPESIPADTVQLARKILAVDDYCIVLREKLGVLYRDEAFADLFSTQGRPGLSPALLAMTTILQYMEGLSDRQAAQQVVTRIDWKYLLGLPLEYSGFDSSVLTEFRARLLSGGQEEYLFRQLVEICRQEKLLKERGKQRTDSTHVLAAVRDLNRLELVAETMRHALNVLATVHPDWLRNHVPLEWYDRYERRVEEYRLPSSKAARQELAQAIGSDGYHLWLLLHQAHAPVGLTTLPAIETLRQVWLQNYYLEEGQVHWRKAGNLPPGQLLIQSPYDIEARYSRKGETTWKGYKVHLTESCDEEHPHLITQVLTTASTQPDQLALPLIQQSLAEHDLLPAEQLVDAGYVDSKRLLQAQQLSIDLVGPLEKDTSWQGRTPDAFDLSCFAVDWQAKQVTCPYGQVSHVWSESTDRGYDVVHVQFSKSTCDPCPHRQRCTTARTQGRSLKMRSQEEHEVIQAARARLVTPEFKEEYRCRAGIEGTVSQGVRTFDLRQARYIGFAKVRLQHIITAVAINLTRIAAWFADPQLAQTRTSRFAALRPAI
jgi:transposase